MEKLDGSTRQSAIHSIINREKVGYNDRPYSSTSTMAAAAVASPASMYSHPPPAYTWAGPASSVSSLISPPGSRRTSDNRSEGPPPIQASRPHRQSLPSLHEALHGGPKPSLASPISAVQQQMSYPQQGPQLPRSYAPPEHSQYAPPQPPSQPKQPSPPPAHLQSFSRPEQGSTNPFSEPSRHPSLSTLQAPPAPLNSYAPRFEQTRYERDPRSQERAPNGYHQPPPPPPQSYSYGPGHGPMQQNGPPPTFSQPHYQPQHPRGMIEEWHQKPEKQEFIQGLKRNLEVYDFEDNLAQINKNSVAIHNWSAHYNTVAQEQQQSSNIIPDRMPTLEEVDDMIRHNESITSLLQEMKTMIYEQVQHSAHQRMREQGGMGPGDYEDSMYDERQGHGGFGPESKKRRGRAAPPGRCHSCNRAETPEWRRGPDGARTLCNACGLHYAKLTRKNTIMKNSQESNESQSQGPNGSQLRPMSKDGHSPPRPM